MKETTGECFIGMQPDEDRAVADCGCTLVRETDDAIDPAFYQCPLHASARDLLAALEKYVAHTERRSRHACCDEVEDMAHAAIRKAKGETNG